MLLRENLLDGVLRLFIIAGFQDLRAASNDVAKDGEVFVVQARYIRDGGVLALLALSIFADQGGAVTLICLLFLAVLPCA